MNRAALLTLGLALLAGCAGPRIATARYECLREAIPCTTYGFEGGATLVVVADQGVAGFELLPSDGGYTLQWERTRGGRVFERALEVDGAWLRLPKEGVSLGPLAASPLLLQGNGELRRFDAADDLSACYGANARAYLGVVMNASTITGTIPGSPAAKAGVRAGDVLRGAVVGGVRVTLENRLRLAELLPRLRPGERIQLVLERAGQPLELAVELGERPLELWNKTDG
ncbi:MAG: hypothetical protein AB7N76_25340 [Planctomycetota bacterium]